MGDWPGSLRMYVGSMGAAQYLIFLPVLGSTMPALSASSAWATPVNKAENSFTDTAFGSAETLNATAYIPETRMMMTRFLIMRSCPFGYLSIVNPRQRPEGFTAKAPGGDAVVGPTAIPW
jgi:hypothetical protein